MRKEGVNVILGDDTGIEKFESLLDQFSDWTQFKREIKLLSILEGRKLEYRVENILKQKPIYGLMEDCGNIVQISKIAFIIKEMVFTISCGKVLKLNVTIETIDNQPGMTVDSLIKSDFEIILSYKITKDGCIPYFYLEFSGISA